MIFVQYHNFYFYINLLQTSMYYYSLSIKHTVQKCYQYQLRHNHKDLLTLTLTTDNDNCKLRELELER